MKSNNDSSKTLKFIITVKFDQKLGGTGGESVNSAGYSLIE